MKLDSREKLSDLLTNANQAEWVAVIAMIKTTARILKSRKSQPIKS